MKSVRECEDKALELLRGNAIVRFDFDNHAAPINVRELKEGYADFREMEKDVQPLLRYFNDERERIGRTYHTKAEKEFHLRGISHCEDVIEGLLFKYSSEKVNITMSNIRILKERITHTKLLLDLIELRDVLTPEEVEERLVLKARLRHQQRALEAAQ